MSDDAPSATPPVLGRTATSLVEAVNDQPLLVDASQVNRFFAGLAEMPDLSADQLAESVEEDTFWTSWVGRVFRPYKVTDGILTIPVMGSLLDKVTLQWGSWFTGYEYIRRAYDRGMNDDAVRGILFDVDSPGGEGRGNFELVDFIRERRGEKPMTAVANGDALSGGYSIASVADSLVVRPSGRVGSVGVITVHVDMTKALEKRGLNVTLIRSGRYKAEGNPYEELSDHARESIQATSDRLYDTFVDRVAKNRPMTEDDVRATEAQVYGAKESVSIGFADSIGEIRHEQARMATDGRKGAFMSEEATANWHQVEGTPGADFGDDGDFAVSNDRGVFQKTDGKWVQTFKPTAAAQPAPESPPAPSNEQPTDVGAAIKADRQRTADVMGSDEYAGREQLAQNLLLKTDMEADAIIESLKVSPKADGGNGRNHFQEAMDRNPSPSAGQEDPDGDGEVDDKGRTPGARRLLGAAKAAGIGLKGDETEQRAT